MILLAIITVGILYIAVITAPEGLKQSALKGWRSLDLVDRVRALFNSGYVRLAIVRRYADANGSYVGELYLEQRTANSVGYVMIGASLDTLPLDLGDGQTTAFSLDTKNDFLAPMPPRTLRVGSNVPQDNENVKKMVRKLPRYRMTLLVQNRFIEYVMEEEC